jgi:citronellol/citronellal dehydrogenase
MLTKKTIFITGASRGIGREIALRCARDGANIVIAAKTSTPHPTLEGTIYTVAKEVEAAGGKALPLQVDVRDEEAVKNAFAEAVALFGGIDVLINNASAISLTPTVETRMKRFDLMMGVNMRGTFLCSQLAIPHLKNASNPHIINLSPPLTMHKKWFKNHVAYTMSKYGMSMCTLGMAKELKHLGIAVNSLWPKTTIATAAIAVNFPKEVLAASRKPAIMADAAYALMNSNSREHTGQFLVDEEWLKVCGIHDFTEYAVQKGVKLCPDFFLD